MSDLVTVKYSGFRPCSFEVFLTSHGFRYRQYSDFEMSDTILTLISADIRADITDMLDMFNFDGRY